MKRSLPEEYGTEYSDEALLKMIEIVLAQNREWKEIRLCFWESEGNVGETVITIGNRPYGLSDHAVLRLHKFSLEEECFSDWVKEIQREKKLIKRRFPEMTVTSDLR